MEYHLNILTIKSTHQNTMLVEGYNNNIYKGHNYTVYGKLDSQIYTSPIKTFQS